MVVLIFVAIGVLVGSVGRGPRSPITSALDTAADVLTHYGTSVVTAVTPADGLVAAGWGGLVALIGVPLLIAVYVEVSVRVWRLRLYAGLTLIGFVIAGLVTHGSESVAMAVWLSFTAIVLVLPKVFAMPLVCVSGVAFATTWVTHLIYGQKWLGPVAQGFASMSGQPYGLAVVAGGAVSVLPFIIAGRSILSYYRHRSATIR